MHIVESGEPDLTAVAQEIMKPLLGWLESINCTPARFNEVMRSEEYSHDSRLTSLGITQTQFEEGIETIQSLHLYALILGIKKEELWAGFETHQYFAPRWLIENVENAMRDNFAGSCG